MINVGWFKGRTVFVNYNTLCRRSTDVFGGSTSCTVNNCFLSFIYYFFGRIKCTLPLYIKDLRLWYTRSLQTSKSFLGLGFAEKWIVRVLKDHNFYLKGTQLWEKLEANKLPETLIV